MSIIPLTITAHIQDQGDVTVSGPQQFVGSKGHSRRLEGFSISPPHIPGVELEYMAHIENSGDTHWHHNGQFVGTRHQSRRIEGFAVRIKGHAASQYDVKYYAHAADIGDTPVSANGGFVGTRGQAKRIEGMAVWLEQRGGYPVFTPAGTFTPVPTYAHAPTYTPGPAYTPAPAYGVPAAYPQPTFAYAGPPPTLQVVATVQGLPPISASGPQFAGTKGQSRKLEAFVIYGAELEYMAHISNFGDTQWVRSGQQLGHANGDKIEGIAVRVVGPQASQFDVKYYAHIEGQGDSPIGCNGSFVGTRGQSRKLEGIAVWLEPKRY